MPALLERPRKAVVVGAGPVGCLAALALAKHGWNVEVFEGRPGVSDFRTKPFSSTYSNLPQTCVSPPPRLLPSSVPLTWQFHIGELLPWKQLIPQRHRDSCRTQFPCAGA